ncbi:esterase B1-like [Cydia fagiglandana]|uniref:esterase B1-like n=1 Tax=Cydia fagiglandana TaxID=1458189 RepID=UPI002FEE5CDB
MIQVATSKSQMRVRVGNELTAAFTVSTGLKQGDALSPMLFNLVLEHVVRKLLTLDIGVELNGRHRLIGYADDLALLGENREEVEISASVLEQEAAKVGLRINHDKSEYLHMKRYRDSRTQRQNLLVGENTYKGVSKFKYLGCTVTHTHTREDETNIRTQNALRCSAALHKVLVSKLLSRHTKLRIYKTVIRPILMYGCEAWTLTLKEENSLLVTERKVLRKILGPVKRDDGSWTIRKNAEIEHLIAEPNIIELTKDFELPRPIVHTPVGSYRGLRAQDGNYSMFLGIPYAIVDPDNVFGHPIPHKFKGIYEAVDDTSRCPQLEEYNHTISGTLNCLHVNIYVPNSATIDNPLPVINYIFGGNFAFGKAGRYVYGPRFLVRHDVILITFNYRVGPYGFFCLNTSKVPGNQGLKDQVQALRWIKENIRYFGGDNSKISVVGHSSGSVTLDYHQYFLQEQLYNRVILQSGVALSHDLNEDFYPDRDAPIKLAKQLNYSTHDINDALSFLNKVEPHDLIALTRDSGLTFRPCVEKQFADADNYITKYPADLNSVSRRDVDVLIGITNDESYPLITRYIENGNFVCEDFVSLILDTHFEFNNESKLSNEMNKIVRLFYYGDDVQCAENKRPEMNVHADFTLHSPVLRTVRKYLESGVDNTYFYIFSFAGERNYFKDKMNLPFTIDGAFHGDELGYLFDISYMKERLRDEDMLIVDRMTELWTNFVKYGNPTPKPSKLIPLQWPRVTQDKLPYLEINTELRLGSRPMHERMSFLDLLYKDIGHYQRWSSKD